jgi:twitching motility protein PilT
MNINELLQAMIRKGISDIHFKANSVPLIRIHGNLFPTGFSQFTPQHLEELANTLMTPEQKMRFEKEHELDMAYGIDDVSRFRINIYRQKGSIALTMRVVPLRAKTFEELNLPIQTLQKMASEPRGLILISGVTGMGKTTTLNAMLDYINENFQYNIVTVEDPIEYYHSDKKSSISQREIGNDTHSYAKALKYVLRQDPDVVVIGEMRDLEAVQAGITAAETGHLVLSTIHTMDAVQTIDRIIDTYPPHQQTSIRTQLSNVLRGIVGQRLVVQRDGETLLPATEILSCTSLVKKQIAEGKMVDVYKIMEQGAYYGMHTFDQDLLRMCKEGHISVEEAIDKSSNPDDLTLKLKGVELGE